MTMCTRPRETAQVDGEQALPPGEFATLMDEVRAVAGGAGANGLGGRRLPVASCWL